MLVWFDGKVIPEGEAGVGINTPSFRYGQGFFTTTRIEEGVPLWLNDHITRLKSFLEAFSFPVFPEEPVIKAARLIPFVNGISRGVLRIIVFREGEKAKVCVMGESLELKDMMPVKITLAPFRRHSSQPLLRVKSLNYWENILAYEEAERKGFYDALFFNEKEEVCETSRSNIFWVINDTVYTPHIDCGLLPGIARQKVLEVLKKENLKVKEGSFKQEELKKAGEVFLTNSLRGIVPVGEIDGVSYQGEGEMVSWLKRKLEEKMQEYVKTYHR
ncbi:4-amino-4-deoxychorismate lyase [Thermosyntropha lipolytica DSM 11003]|uniref:4-amino-4-deoxychorismate lyase n=1 Tax=Thermosyntropha lipolytica DSM 11003 TaxID=1123382 RepID=A0A1M5JPM5_9FIRM|nr:aminotransferase class IV [Thermosyntropha lipolytica]SHG42365.1 4-amino-4-deoxychorismate lyase [Thermosyntropha lipolytica DSM 11003]